MEKRVKKGGHLIKSISTWYFGGGVVVVFGKK